MKRFLSVVLAIALILACAPAIPLTANAETSGYYTYTVSDAKATITDCRTSISGDITIPATLGGYPVIGISDSAFQDCSSLTSVVIPDSVTSIGSSAFSSCSSLTSVVIGDRVTSIGSRAFEECSSLTSIEIPDRVTYIGDYAFSSCSSLTSVVIPDSVTYIGFSAFSTCRSLTSVEIPDSVTYIGSSAFLYCSSLTSVVIPDSVTYISSSAFRLCSSLTSVEIPDSVTKIGSRAFEDCSSLTSVEIPDSVTIIDSDAFRDCSSLTSVVIGDRVTIIDSATFYGCNSLTSVVIPDSVTSIGSDAFFSCGSLSHVAYTGTQSQWNRIDIGSYNSDLTAATRHCEIKMIDNCVEAGLYCPVCKEFITHTVKDGGAHSYTDCYDLSCDTCNYNRTITGISLSELPEKLGYLRFEELDITGGEVLVTFNDGSTGVTSLTEEMVTGFDSATVGTKTVTVTYESFTTTFTVTVKEELIVCEHIETASQYKTIEEALAVATNGTIKLLMDATADTILLKPDVTLDLNGHTLAADSVIVFNGAAITDGGNNCTGGGLLKVPEENLGFMRENGQGVIPVWNGVDGYVFTKVSYQQLAMAAGSGAAQYIFLPTFSNAEASVLMADGGVDNGVQIKVSLNWGNGQSQQFYTYSDDLVEKVFDGTGRWVFSLTITGISGITDMTAQAVVVTDSGAQATNVSTAIVAG